MTESLGLHLVGTAPAAAGSGRDIAAAVVGAAAVAVVDAACSEARFGRKRLYRNDFVVAVDPGGEPEREAAVGLVAVGSSGRERLRRAALRPRQKLGECCYG